MAWSAALEFGIGPRRGGGAKAQSDRATFHDRGFAYSVTWANLGSATATWTIEARTATSITVSGDIQFDGQRIPFGGTAVALGGKFQNAYMDATKGGPDGIMWAVSSGGHHLWASSTTQSFTMANPAITYTQGKKNALKALNNSGMKAGTLAMGAAPGSTTGPGGGGGCWPYSSNQYVDGQGWSDCTEASEAATESGSWSPGPKQYASDGAGNGFDSRIELYANSDQPTGSYSGTATARLQYWSPFESYWTSNASFPWTYEVVP